MPDQRSASRSALAAGLAIALLAIVDCVVVGVTVPILYPVPLILHARSRRRAALPWLTALCVVLTFVGYAIQLHAHWFHDPRAMLSYRLINRSMVAFSIAVTGAVLWYWLGLRAEVEGADAAAGHTGRLSDGDGDGDGAVHVELRHAVTLLAGCIMGGVLIACGVVVDLLTPPQLNLPILYAIPLLVGLWAQSRRVIWMLLPVLLGLTIAGYFWDPPAVRSNLVLFVLTNRLIAAAAIVLVAFLLDFWIREERARALRRRSEEQPEHAHDWTIAHPA